MMKALSPGSMGQILILVAVILGWGYSLVEYYALQVATAQPIADGGWAALLAIMRLDFSGSAQPPIAAGAPQPPAA